MMSITLQLVYIITIASIIHENTCDNSSMKRSDFLHHLLKSYDSELPPNFDTDEPTVVFCNVYVNSFDSINEINMDYAISILMRQSWVDDRLMFNHNIKDSMITLGPAIIDKIWVPDLYFSNSKFGNFHKITVPNRVLMVKKNGMVTYSSRLSLTLSCPMDLLKFPLDTQMCLLKLESFTFDTDRMLFRWIVNNPVEFSEGLQLPQFEIVSLVTEECTQIYSLGNFTCLEIKFFLRRQLGYYVIQTYIPCSLIVMLSWVSFWINGEAVAARISLGIITVLAMITQSNGIGASLPRVSYIKAIDVWMSTCLAFVFFALLEYAFINVSSRKEIKTKTQCRNYHSKTENIQMQTRNIPEVSEGNLIDQGTNLKPTLVDKTARILFPVVFLLFNVVYWLTYLLLKDNFPALSSTMNT